MIQQIGVAALVGILAAPTVLTTPHPGTWFSQARYLWPGPTAIADWPADGRHLLLKSPDGRTTAVIDDSELRLRDAAGRHLGVVAPVASLAEMLWAPTSDAFVITESDGGWVGTWGITVYRLHRSGLRSSRPMDFVLADFKRRFPRCPDEYPNVAAVTWARDASQLAVVVEMPCHGSCSDMCKIVGYVIDPATGVIARHLSAADVRQEWTGAVGPRLAETP